MNSPTDSKWCSKVKNLDEEAEITSENFEWCADDDSCPGTTVESTPQMDVDPRNAKGNCYCGIPNYPIQEDKIVGGSKIAVGVYPWQVALLFGKEQKLSSQACGGTLVGDKYIVTAAHCTFDADTQKDMEADEVSVRIGDTSLDTDKEVEGAQTVKVKKILNHPDYNSETKENDIAILVLKKKVSLTKYPNIKPACLPIKGSTHTGKGYISGWGTLNSGGHSTSWLHGAEVNVFEDKDCGSWKCQMTQDMMCAGWIKGGIDTCQGDSGGPLMTKDPTNNNWMTLIGVVSYGSGCAEPDSLGIYSKVSENYDWLMYNMPNYHTHTCPKHDDVVPQDEGNIVKICQIIAPRTPKNYEEYEYPEDEEYVYPDDEYYGYH